MYKREKVNRSFAQEGSLKETNTKVTSKGMFRPKDILNIDAKDERYSYRWMSVKKLEKQGWRDYRGWEVVKQVDGGFESSQSSGSLDASQALDSTIRAGDLVLGRMDKETAQQTADYYKNKTNVQTELINQRQQGTRDGIKREISFEQRRGKNVIKEE